MEIAKKKATLFLLQIIWHTHFTCTCTCNLPLLTWAVVQSACCVVVLFVDREIVSRDPAQKQHQLSEGSENLQSV